ncbi:penicillin-binding protein activator LpoB [Methyloprofundus sp.]|uniref:penicillin-binding protein activator LpoB n=1 Tax=Methyloprofundus sp. TaxID=2020875 RepID=UPI003D0F1C33
MNKKLISLLAATSTAFFLTACGTSPTRIDATGNDGLVTVDGVDFKDWQIAAEKGINSLLESGVLNRTDGRKTIMMISTIKNSTTQHINTRILTDKIRQALLRSGKALTTTAVGGNGPDDAASKQVRRLEEDDMFNQSTVQKRGTAIAPDMSLSGEIVQQTSKQGRMRESYFFFHMAVTDLATGLAVWEDNVEIAKQGKQPLMGW